MAHVRTYNPSVRVGNWFEDIALEEEMLADFLKRKAAGQLLTQQPGVGAGGDGRTSISTAPITTSSSSDGLIHFGDCLVLVNDGNFNECDGSGRVASSLALSQHNETPDGEVEFACAASRGTEATGRTAFVICSVKGKEADGAPLNFGQHFLLRDAAAGRFLQSDNGSAGKISKNSRNQVVEVVDRQSYLAEWKAAHADPRIRPETDYTPVPANTKLVIFHCKSGQALCAEDAPMRTDFGIECEATCHTYLDSHKAEMSGNHWRFYLPPYQPYQAGTR